MNAARPNLYKKALEGNTRGLSGEFSQPRHPFLFGEVTPRLVTGRKQDEVSSH